MKKMPVLLIILMMISIGFLSGCEEEDGTVEAIDTDGDGYNDDVDDFPDDSNLHEKSGDVGTTVSTPTNWTIDVGTGGSGFGGYITSDWKYITCEWTITSPTNLNSTEKELIELIIDNPVGRTTYKYTNPNSHNIRIPITSSNWGDWEWSFHHHIPYPGPSHDIILYLEFYKIR